MLVYQMTNLLKKDSNFLSRTLKSPKLFTLEISQIFMKLKVYISKKKLLSSQYNLLKYSANKIYSWIK